MKTYKQAIESIARSAVGDEMGGGYGQPRNEWMVAFIFEKTMGIVSDDVQAQMKVERDKIYAQSAAYNQKKITA